MALLFTEGFDAFGTTVNVAPSGIARKWGNVQAGNGRIDTGRFGGRCVRGAGDPSGSNIFRIDTPNLGSPTTLIIGVAWKVSSFVNDGRIFALLEPGGTASMSVRMVSGGDLRVSRDTTTLASTSGLALSTDTWYYLELKATIGNSLGAYELRVNEVNVLSASSVDTQVGGTANYVGLRLQPSGTSGTHYYDDLYICDSSGAIHNDFLGNKKIVTLFPIAEGTSSSFTPSSGTDNSALLDENPSNDDTDYVESSTSGHKDLYDYTSISGIDNVEAIVVNTIARETDANPFSLITVVKSGSTEEDSSSAAIGSGSYVHKQSIVPEDPDTNSPWTASGINGAEFGIKVA